MQQKKISELLKGDLFCFEIKLKDRNVYIVENIIGGILTYINRSDGAVNRIFITNKDKYIIFIKHTIAHQQKLF